MNVKHFLYFIALGLCFISCKPKIDIRAENDYAKAFDLIWQELEKDYVNFDKQAYDWDEIHDIYLQKMNQLTTENASQMYGIFQSLLDTIKDPELWLEYTAPNNLIWNYTYKRPVQHDIDYAFFPIYQQKFNDFECPTKYLDYNGLIITKLIRIHDNDTSWYNFFATLGGAPIQMNTLKNFFEAFANNTIQKTQGVIFDLRENRLIAPDLALELLESLSPVSMECTIETQERSLSKDRTKLKPKHEKEIKGMGICDTIPISIIVNERTTGSANIIAYILSSLPNVSIIGRASTGGGGGWLKKLEIASNINFYYPVSRLSNCTYSSFEEPLQPDTLVEIEWQRSWGSVISKYEEPCVSAAIDKMEQFIHQRAHN